MIFNTVEKVKKTDSHVNWGNGTSSRLLVANDGVGYTIAETRIFPNTSSHLKYQNHIESCFCVSGSGALILDETGDEFVLSAGALYTLNLHDSHILKSGSDGLVLISFFLPALNGTEIHDLTGNRSSTY